MTDFSVLVIGSSGMLGKDISQVFKENGFTVIGADINNICNNFLDRFYKIDIRNQQDILKLLENEKPHLIIYTAAIVNLNVCEENKELAESIHVEVPEFILQSINDDVKFVYISTDSVFDGEEGNYVETDLVNPLNYYSYSKYLGEKACLNYKNSIIVRTNIFGFNNPLKQSLAEWAIQKLKSGERIVGFDDVIFNAIYTMDLSRILYDISQLDLNGIINIAAKGKYSKYEFLISLALGLGFDTNLIDKGSSQDVTFPIKRPLKTYLNTTLIESMLNIPTIKETINNFCQNLKINDHENW